MAEEKNEGEPDEDLRRRALAQIESKWQGSRQCPICTAATWTLGDLGAVPRANSDGDVNFSSIFPGIPLVCTNCGYTHWFNALIARLVGPVVESSTESASEEDER